MQENYFRDIGKYLYEIRNIDRVFQYWCYDPTIVPMIDYSGPYEGIEGIDFSKTYRIVDSNKEMLFLRADSTLFLARTISKHAHSSNLPLRLSYSNSVVRPTKAIDNSERRQSGVELVGVQSIAGDLEVILLVCKALEYVTKKDFQIHIGSRRVIIEMLRTFNANYTESEIVHILSLIATRDFGSLNKILPPHIYNTLLQIMDMDEFRLSIAEIQDLLPPNSTCFQSFCVLMEALSEIINPTQLRIDFSELGGHSYYSNIVFSAYVAKLPRAVAHGGRYDALMRHLGVDIPAVGATLFPHIMRGYLLEREDGLEEYNSALHLTNAFDALSEVAYPTVQDLVKCGRAQFGRVL